MTTTKQIDSIHEAFEARALARKKWESKKGMKKGDRKGKGKAASDDESDSGSDSDADSDDGSDSENETIGKRKPSNTSNANAQGGAAGIRQVRIGTFEDSGKCKG